MKTKIKNYYKCIFVHNKDNVFMLYNQYLTSFEKIQILQCYGINFSREGEQLKYQKKNLKFYE